MRQPIVVVVLLVTAQLYASADVLVLRDGRRVDGSLVAVRGDWVEFEQADGARGWTTRRYERHDVRSIQFDERLAYDPPSPPRFGRPGNRERVVTVDARRPWTDTGVVVRAGQTIAFSPDGSIRWGPGRRDDADGEKRSPYNAGRPMPHRNAAALIGRIDDGDPFFIGGGAGPIRMPESGRLYLGINDDYLTDNSGALRVTIVH